MFVECRNDVVDGQTIICVTVQRGTARPYYLQSKGIRPEGVYVRQGASTVPATDTAILNMIKETSGDSYEAARSLNQQLTFEKATAFFDKRKTEFGKLQMRTLHLIGEDGMYTNLAFLLSDQCTHMIKLAIFEGSRKTVFKDRRELSGSLLEQLEEAFDYIDRYNRTRAEFSGLDRVDIFSGPTLISIFDDRIEFVTIGGLVKGITLEDVKLGVSVLRNQRLANVFYRLHLIEAYGTGILKINESYDGCDVKPLIETTSNAFKITLPNCNYRTESQNSQAIGRNSGETSASKKEDRIHKILDLCHSKGSLVRADVEEVLGVSQSTAILLLRELVEEGVLIKKGKGKRLRYFENK